MVLLLYGNKNLSATSFESYSMTVENNSRKRKKEKDSLFAKLQTYN